MKLYVTARAAAQLLGVPLERVVEDIERGFTHHDSLTGGEEHGLWAVHSFELEGARLAMHRQRLADRASAVPARCRYWPCDLDEQGRCSKCGTIEIPDQPGAVQP